MSIQALAERTWKTQQVIIAPMVALGALLLVAGLALRFPVLTGFGTAFAFGGGFGLWRLRVKAAEFQALLENPKRVARIVPIQQTMAGAVVNFPVVLVADDGKSYRIGTWARNARDAVAPFIERFPHAAGLDEDAAFAPDAGLGARVKLIGLMMGSLLAGLLVAGLVALPQTYARIADLEAAQAHQLERDRIEAEALSAVAGADLQQPWTDCSIDSLDPLVSVLLDGAKPRSSSTRRKGYLGPSGRLSLETPVEHRVYGTDFFGAWLDAVLGHRSYSPSLERALAIVGARRDDALKLRLVNLDGGKVLCEGRAPVAAVRGDSSFDDDKALSQAVVGAFCKQLPEGTCLTPSAATAQPTPKAAGPQAKAAAPKTAPKAAAPRAPAGRNAAGLNRR